MPRRWLHSFVSLYRFGKTYETLHHDKDKPHKELDYHHREVRHGERIGWLLGTIKKVCDLTNVQPPLEFLDKIREHVRSLPPEDWVELAKQIWEELPEDAQASVLHELMDLEYSSFSQKEKSKIVNDTITIIFSHENPVIKNEDLDCNGKLLSWLMFPSVGITSLEKSSVEAIENKEVLEEIPSILFGENTKKRKILHPGCFLREKETGRKLKVTELVIDSPGKSSFLELRSYIRKKLDAEGIKGLV